MYGNHVNSWSSNLPVLDRLKYSINVFTRMRYCYPNKQLNLFCKKSPFFIDKNLQPWFSINRKIPKEYSIFFGHWSSLQGTDISPPLFPLDSGCCWGKSLKMIRWEDKKHF
ncbi:diadenosine tetraphosphatase, partial [Buchnera aphidicola]|nr:diadenosine tetraphosphatase [Buchnera aphidicola]